jgi:hypothetical protein
LALEIFLLYNTLWDEKIAQDVIQLLAYIYWISISGVFIVLILYDGATVNSAVSLK